MDAQEILMSINKIQKQIEGEEVGQDIDKEENSFQAGFSENTLKIDSTIYFTIFP